MRPRSCVPSALLCPRTRAALLGGCLGLGASSTDAAPPATGVREKVHITYRAPPECPDEQAFLAGVRARIGTEWEALPHEMAREMKASVSVTPASSIARLDFVDASGRHVSRSVSGATCTEAAEAIALITAVAIESGITETVETTDKATTDASNTRSEGSAAPAPEPPPGPKVPGQAQPAPIATSTAPAAWHGDVGALAAVSSGVGPTVAWGGRFVAGIGWPGGPDLRLGVDYVATSATTVPVNGGATMQTYQLGGRLSGCPFVFDLGASFRTLPCAGVLAGIIHAETRASAGVIAPGAANPFVFAPFAELRADLQLGVLFVEGSVEARFTVNKPTFALESPHETPHLYDVPLVAVGGSLGLGLRL